MKLIAENGRQLDADFLIEAAGDEFDLILKSSGGSNPQGRKRRNPDYNPALEVLLARLGAIEAILQFCALDSKPVQNLPLSSRLIQMVTYPYPVVLSGITDSSVLRLAMLHSQRLAGGNGASQIRLRVTLPARRSLSELETLLVGPERPADPAPGTWNQQPTDDPDVLEDRVSALRLTISKTLAGKHLPPPPGGVGGKPTTLLVRRFTRDPNVVAWILEQANGMCEVCQKSAPFQRSSGGPFLEVHHVRTLAEGGPDNVNNTVAVCPNCHRQLHLGIDREDLRRSVIVRIPRLVDHPLTSLPINEPEAHRHD